MRDPSGEAPLGNAPPKPTHSIASLRLDIKAAAEGKTWLLLPEGFRDQDSGKTYPLPAHVHDLERLTAILIPLNKNDSGCIYLKRAVEAYKAKMRRRQSATLDLGRTRNALRGANRAITNEVKEMRAEAQKAIDAVHAAAKEAVASLNDLFALGRKGIDGQMRAHLDGVEWKGETINARAFRECFRMVSQTVKSLGLPSEQRDKASEAIMEQLAESLEGTKDAVALAPGAASLAPGADDETPQ